MNFASVAVHMLINYVNHSCSWEYCDHRIVFSVMLFVLSILAHRRTQSKTSKVGFMHEGDTEEGSAAPANGHCCDEWPPSCW